MTLVVAFALGGVLFSLVVSLLANIRAARSQKTVYEVWLDDVSSVNVVSKPMDFTRSASVTRQDRSSFFSRKLGVEA